MPADQTLLETHRLRLVTASQRLSRLAGSAWTPGLVLGACFGVALLVQALRWPDGMSFDAWSYESWGDSLLRGDAPLYDHARTTPKPLGIFLGAAVGPLPPERGMLVPVTAGLGLLVASLFVAAFRRGGPVAAVAAISAFAIVAPIGRITRSALIDGVTAGLIALAVALGGWASVAVLILAGLLRPEAWPLVGLAAYLAMDGERKTRVGAALLAAFVPIGVWVAVDFLFTGDALATKHASERLALSTRPWTTLPSWIVTGLEAKTVTVIALGAIGFGLYLWRRRSADGEPLLAVLALVVWPVLVTYQARQGFHHAAVQRYFLPLTGLMTVGCGLLLSSATDRWVRHRGAWLAAAISCVPLALVLVPMVTGERGGRNSHDAIRAAAPAIQRVAPCGRVALVGTERGVAFIPHISLLTGRPAEDFEFRVPGRTYEVALRVDLLRHRRGLRKAALPDWPRVQTAIGPLAISPACAAALP